MLAAFAFATLAPAHSWAQSREAQAKILLEVQQLRALRRAGQYETVIERGPKLAKFMEAEPGVGKDNAYYIRVLDDIGYAYDRLHRYSEALPIWKELVAISEIHNGPDHEFTIDFMQYLSSTYDGLGRYAEADAIGNRALAILDQK